MATVLEHFEKQFAYNAWANREALRKLSAIDPDARSLEIYAHIIAAEKLWSERLRSQPQSSPVWPHLDLKQCATESASLHDNWRQFIGALLNVEGLGAPCSYTNSKGEKWQNTVEDILTHVILHSAYHRGQLASHMREQGFNPPYTDFIHAVRQGLITWKGSTE